jgi:site-specific DNA recombinase
VQAVPRPELDHILAVRDRPQLRDALELGRWVFLAPIGYLNAPRATGKSLVADPGRAPLVRRAFEEYATGRFTKEQLLKQSETWGVTNRRGRRLRRKQSACCCGISCTLESPMCRSTAFAVSAATSNR